MVAEYSICSLCRIALFVSFLDSDLNGTTQDERNQPLYFEDSVCVVSNIRFNVTFTGLGQATIPNMSLHVKTSVKALLQYMHKIEQM